MKEAIEERDEEEFEMDDGLSPKVSPETKNCPRRLHLLDDFPGLQSGPVRYDIRQ